MELLRNVRALWERGSIGSICPDSILAAWRLRNVRSSVQSWTAVELSKPSTAISARQRVSRRNSARSIAAGSLTLSLAMPSSTAILPAMDRFYGRTCEARRSRPAPRRQRVSIPPQRPSPRPAPRFRNLIQSAVRPGKPKFRFALASIPTTTASNYRSLRIRPVFGRLHTARLAFAGMYDKIAPKGIVNSTFSQALASRPKYSATIECALRLSKSAARSHPRAAKHSATLSRKGSPRRSSRKYRPQTNWPQPRRLIATQRARKRDNSRRPRQSQGRGGERKRKGQEADRQENPKGRRKGDRYRHLP